MPDFLIIRADQLAAMSAVAAADAPAAATELVAQGALPEANYAVIPADEVEVVRVCPQTSYVAEPAPASSIVPRPPAPVEAAEDEAPEDEAPPEEV